MKQSLKPTLLLMLLLWLSPASFSAQSDSLYENTNLALYDVPDVIAEGVKPYDVRLYEIESRINGQRCCNCEMYRVDGKKIVLLSHDGAYFLAFLITDEGSKMYFAEEPGVFTEQPMEKGGTWSVPEWLKAN